MFPTTTELDQAHERHEAFAAEAIRSRAVRQRTWTVRRAIGLRIVAFGRRLMGEPAFELARSR